MQCFPVINTFYLHYFTFLTIALKIDNNIDWKTKAQFTPVITCVTGVYSGHKSTSSVVTLVLHLFSTLVLALAFTFVSYNYFHSICLIFEVAISKKIIAK